MNFISPRVTSDRIHHQRKGARRGALAGLTYPGGTSIPPSLRPITPPAAGACPPDRCPRRRRTHATCPLPVADAPVWSGNPETAESGIDVGLCCRNGRQQQCYRSHLARHRFWRGDAQRYTGVWSLASARSRIAHRNQIVHQTTSAANSSSTGRIAPSS